MKCAHCKGRHETVAQVRHCATPVQENPWIELHLQAEFDYTGDGYSRKAARVRVLREYAGHEGPIQCGHCGHETAWYRATVGAIQCVDCRAIRSSRIVDNKVETRWINPR